MGSSQNNMIEFNMTAENNTIYEVAIRGILNSANLNGSAMVRAYTRSGFVNQHNIPVWYNNNSSWYNVTINFEGSKIRFFSSNLQQSLYITVIKWK